MTSVAPDDQPQAGFRVLLAGATGLVGRATLRILLRDERFSHVTALARRGPAEPVTSPRLDWRSIDFDTLHSMTLPAVTHVICALGTTMAVAGSKDRFREVDHDYPLALARVGLSAGARHCLLVSALGANAGSRIFYNRTKGEVEIAIRELPYRSVTIARPSLLLGEREQRRRGEELGAMFSFLTPSRYKPIRAEVVARALVELAARDEPGTAVIESSELQRIGASGI